VLRSRCTGGLDIADFSNRALTWLRPRSVTAHPAAPRSFNALFIRHEQQPCRFAPARRLAGLLAVSPFRAISSAMRKSGADANDGWQLGPVQFAV
jgi:hypothetical protein